MIRNQRDTLKSVKVDNWGTFFLQKLQNFFNKTDYCDLTLQFMDNSQLKVHRLVLSACTDYFNMLEQNCEMIEDILMMPSDLQADVIVPIVNFMYTGTLEFHYSMYEKLLKTSREMNMTVLSKLLEAHRQTSTVAKSAHPVLLNKNAANAVRFPKVFHQKPLPTKTVQIYKQGQTIIKHVSPTKPNIPEPIQIVTRFQSDNKNTSRPSRFIVPDEIIPDTEGSFESISYESKPLQTASQLKREEENSPFESLRRGYTNKRAATLSSQSPPTKKPNLDDIKAEAEAQSQRNELITEDVKEPQENVDEGSDDDDYDADQYFDDEGSDDSSKNQKSSPSTIIKQTTKQITVSDCSGGNIDHAKILGEVLKKYPNLVKNPKNIKLKIMQKPSQSNSQQTTAIVRVVKQDSSAKIVTSTPQQRQQASSNNQQPKKIDAKTMHELIRMGAENMKGPWLCLECGSSGRPISIPTYKKFRAHLINVHKQKIDPRICEHCGLKPARRIELIQHQLIAHNINPPADVPLFRCTTKSCVFVTQKEDLLMKHKREVHKEFQQKCRYCSKVFNKEFLLHAHMRAVHRHMAKTDGVMEFSEDEEYEPINNSKEGNFITNVVAEKKTNKIEILSNIEIPAGQAISMLEGSIVSQPSSEAEALTNVATGIATSLALVDNVVIEDQFNIEQQLAQVHGEYEEPKKDDNSGIITRLVAEDGTEMVLTAAQKEEILQQLQQQGATLSDNVVMVLDQSQLNVEDQNIQMVMFSGQDTHPTETTTSTSVSTIKLKPEELEKAEIVFQDDENDNVKEKPEEDEGDKSRIKLLADLEEDWVEEDRSQESKEEEKIPLSLNPIEKNEQLDVLNTNTESEDKTNEKTNEDLKDILNDWDDDDADSPSTNKLEKSNNNKEDSQIENDEILEAKIDENLNEAKSNEEAIDNNIKESNEEDENIPNVDEDKESDKRHETDGSEVEKEGNVATTNEKSKIITDLLDEWNDL